MKTYQSFLKFLFVIFAAFTVASCVHDDKYDTPDLNGYQCGDLTANMTLADAKALPQNATITTPSIIEGYVSSSDETGNIYKTLYIQDDPQNPTHGFVVSLDAVSTYTKFPQGSKVYIKDFKEIGKYIKNKRLNEVYALLDFVRQYKKSL